MKNKYILFAVVIFCCLNYKVINAQSGLMQGRTVLPASPVSGRLDAVLDNVAMIRLQPEFSSPGIAESAILSIGGRIIGLFLKPEQSLRYQFEKNNNNAIRRIFLFGFDGSGKLKFSLKWL